MDHDHTAGKKWTTVFDQNFKNNSLCALFAVKPFLVIGVTFNGNATLETTSDIIFEVLIFFTLTTIAFITFTKRYDILKTQINNQFYKSYLLSYIFANMATYSLLVILVIYKQNWSYFDSFKKLNFSQRYDGADNQLIYGLLFMFILHGYYQLKCITMKMFNM